MPLLNRVGAASVHALMRWVEAVLRASTVEGSGVGGESVTVAAHHAPPR